jgi:hypothetical protein
VAEQFVQEVDPLALAPEVGLPRPLAGVARPEPQADDRADREDDGREPA